MLHPTHHRNIQPTTFGRRGVHHRATIWSTRQLQTPEKTLTVVRRVVPTGRSKARRPPPLSTAPPREPDRQTSGSPPPPAASLAAACRRQNLFHRGCHERARRVADHQSGAAVSVSTQDPDGPLLNSPATSPGRRRRRSRGPPCARCGKRGRRHQQPQALPWRVRR
jgi:hypothetical protein